jgi:hypothetical protein
MGRWGTIALPGLAGGGGVQGTVVEFDFFDETDGELVVGEPDVLGGVNARAALLAKPPERQGAKDRDRLVRGGGGAVGFQDVGPDDGVAIEGGGSVRHALVDVGLGLGFEIREPGFPSGVNVVRGDAAIEGGLVDLAAAVPSGWVIFNPGVMFEGDQPSGFLFFCEFAFRVSTAHGGRKIFACDELQTFVGTNQVPRELALVCEDGRLRGLDMMFISSAPNLIHNRLRGQVTEAVAFRTEEDNPLSWLIERRFDPDQVQTLQKGQYICRNLLTGVQVNGRVF